MGDKKLGIFILATIVIVVVSMASFHPFQHEVDSTGKVPRTFFKIIIEEGKITRVNLAFTISNQTPTTNGYIIIATKNGTIATYTLINYINNSQSETTYTTTGTPQDFIITYNKGYLTYDGLTYYTDTGNPIVFGTSSTQDYNFTVFVAIDNATVNWIKTTTI